ncbi:MAG: hypothetical protein WC975_15500 [Phycisphaerae bacterium]
MKSRIAVLSLVVFLTGTILYVYAESKEEVPPCPPGKQASESKALPSNMGMEACMLMGANKDMNRRMGMMRKAGVSEDMIREWSAFVQAPIYMDSPAMLLGQTDMLTLNSDQKQKLMDIEKDAREKAMMVLTEAQKSKLGTISDQPMTMMQIHQGMCAKMAPMRQKMMKEGGMRHGKMGRGGKGCPMCPMMTPENTQTTQPAEE